MKKNPIILVALIISLITTMFTIYERIQVESEYKTVEFTIDYKEAENLANQSDKDLGWWLEGFNELGFKSVALYEETIHSLQEENEDLEAKLFANIIKNVDWRDEYPKSFIDYVDSGYVDKYDLVLLTKSQGTFNAIKDGLSARYPQELYKVVSDNEEKIIVLDGDEDDVLYSSKERINDSKGETIDYITEIYSSKLIYLGIGFDKIKIDLIKSSGLQVLPRPNNYKEYSDRLVEGFITEVEKYDMMPSTMIFTGKEILGYPNDDSNLAQFMKKNNISIGLVESGVQREHIEHEGIEQLTSELDYNAVRVFTVWDWVRKQYRQYNYQGAEEVENAMYRAITERNIRVIYFRPFMEDSYDYVTDYAEYERTFSSLRDRLEDHKIYFGNHNTMDNYQIGNLRVTIIGSGVIALGIMLLVLLFNIKGRRQSAISNSLVVLGTILLYLILMRSRDLGEKVLALSASIVFPSASILYFITKLKDIVVDKKDIVNIRKVIVKAISMLMISIVISLIGGLFVGAILSNISYLLEINIFRGVKFSQLVPLLGFALIYFVKFSGMHSNKYGLDVISIKDKVVKFLDHNIKVKYVLFTAVILLAGYVYIARTGHETTIGILDIELIFRNYLENSLLSRPRTKEFLMAFPALMLAVYLAFNQYKKAVLPFALIGTLGLTSIVNTFSHLRTPIYLSVVRTAYSAGFGIVLGTLGIVLLSIILRIIHPISERGKIND